MSSFHQVLIGGNKASGLMTDRKPLMLPDEAYSKLDNAYVFRERTKKRDGLVGVGRLQRVFTNEALPNLGDPGWSGSGPYVIDIFSNISPAITETYAQLDIGSVFVTLNNGMDLLYTDSGEGTLTTPGSPPLTGSISVVRRISFDGTCTVTTDTPNGLLAGFNVTINGTVGSGSELINGKTFEILDVLSSTRFTIHTVGGRVLTNGGTWSSSVSGDNVGFINYLTSELTIYTTYLAGSTVNITFNYYPTLPAMGICPQDISTIGIDKTIYFDTKYAYEYQSGFQQYGTAVWTAPDQSNGTNLQFFWSANYQGLTADKRLFFATNNYIDTTVLPNGNFDPIRYYDTSWHNLIPLIDNSNYMVQALIIIPYYGRLLALNIWESSSNTIVTSATNFYSRCRFSQLGDPTATDSWKSNIFGKGGFIDAPTNESIVGAAFFRNTLIVFFEYSTWQLRYIGEYGLPFIFERISSDFGSTSTFSPIVFDEGVRVISNRGAILANASGIRREDESIPETIFGFNINTPEYVHGVRDFEKEVVYWNYLDDTDSDEFQYWPTNTLLYNYRNQTWARFRDTITCFGKGQFQNSITWDSLSTFWESEASWDNVDDQVYVDYVVAGNQHGYISIYENQDANSSFGSNNTLFSPSLSIYGIDLSQNPIQLKVPNHNLANGEIIYITDCVWDGIDPAINNIIFKTTVIDKDTITLSLWNGTNYVSQNFTTSSAIYLGGGQIALFPKMNIVGKDFNPFQSAGKQFKLSYIDFQMDANNSVPSLPAVSIQLFVNSYLGIQSNLIYGNKELINNSQQVGIITGISQSNPCNVKSPDHSLITGQVIYISNVLGMDEINQANYKITVVDSDNFTLDGINSSGFTAYISGGTWNCLPKEGQNYTSAAQYAWYRFYSTIFGQYLRVAITYDDALMNQLSTHQNPMELNAMNLWFREGGRLIN